MFQNGKYFEVSSRHDKYFVNCFDLYKISWET